MSVRDFAAAPSFSLIRPRAPSPRRDADVPGIGVTARVVATVLPPARCVFLYAPLSHARVSTRREVEGSWTFFSDLVAEIRRVDKRSLVG